MSHDVGGALKKSFVTVKSGKNESRKDRGKNGKLWNV
jgi:hypothetical protein